MAMYITMVPIFINLDIKVVYKPKGLGIIEMYV